jgi:hypothetical protein
MQGAAAQRGSGRGDLEGGSCAGVAGMDLLRAPRGRQGRGSDAAKVWLAASTVGAPVGGGDGSEERRGGGRQ